MAQTYTLVRDNSLLQLTFACQNKKISQEVIQKRLAQLVAWTEGGVAVKHAQIEAGQSMKKLRVHVA